MMRSKQASDPEAPSTEREQDRGAPGAGEPDPSRAADGVAHLSRLSREAEDVLLAQLDLGPPPEQALEPLEPALAERLLRTAVGEPGGAAPQAGPLARLWAWFSAPSALPRLALAPTLIALLIGGGVVYRYGGRGQGGPLERFEMQMDGEDAVLGAPAAAGGSDEQPVRVHSDTTLEVILRPQGRDVKEPLEAVAYLRRGAWRPWPVTLTPHPGGVFQLKAQTQTLPDLNPGSYEIAFVVARRGKLPGLEQLRPHLDNPRLPQPHDWQLLRRQIQVQAPAQP